MTRRSTAVVVPLHRDRARSRRPATRRTTIARSPHAVASRPPAILTLNEAAQFLRVSVRQVQRLRQTGHLPATRIGSRAVVRAADLDRYVENLDGAA